VKKGSLNTVAVETELIFSIKELQDYDRQIELIKNYLAKGGPSFFCIAEDGALYFKGKLVVSRKEENLNVTPRVMREAHDTPLSIHPGSTKMYQDIRQRFWWSNVKQDIAKYVAECDV
jgi:hypothetical protein